MTERENIKQALAALIGNGEPLVPELAMAMNQCRLLGSIAYENIVAIAGDDAAELLLLAWNWKMLVPRRSLQCAEWDDRVLGLEPGEQYDMVNVVKWLLDAAAKTGCWQVIEVVRDLYAWMGEPQFAKMPALVRQLVQQAQHQRITGAGIHVACAHHGFGDRTGAMIAILKGGGVISPHLTSSSPMQKTKSPLYDLHPVLIHLLSEGSHDP